jgi:hypothetical protein
MSDRGALVPFGGCIAALVLAGTVVGAPWSYVLYAFAGLLLLALISEELFLILGLGASAMAIDGLVGQGVMTALWGTCVIGLIVPAVLGVLDDALHIVAMRRARKRRRRGRDSGGIDHKRRRSQRWGSSRELLRSPSQYLVSVAVRRLPPDMARSECSRWEQEMRADVDSIRWAPIRLLYAIGVCRRGAPAMPHGESSQPDGTPQRYS